MEKLERDGFGILMEDERINNEDDLSPEEEAELKELMEEENYLLDSGKDFD